MDRFLIILLLLLSPTARADYEDDDYKYATLNADIEYWKARAAEIKDELSTYGLDSQPESPIERGAAKKDSQGRPYTVVVERTDLGNGKSSWRVYQHYLDGNNAPGDTDEP